ILYQKCLIEMNQYSLIIRMLIKVMNLIGCYKKDGVIKNLIRFKINEMLSLPTFKPYYLIEAVYMGFGYAGLICFYMIFQIKNCELWFIRLMPVQMILINYVVFFFRHSGSLSQLHKR